MFSDYYEREQTDFTAVLLKMKSLNPDSLYIDVRWSANVTVLKQMAELGLKKQLFGSVNFYNTKLVERAGPLLEGAYMSVAWAPVFQDAASKKFVEAYQRWTTRRPTTRRPWAGPPAWSSRPPSAQPGPAPTATRSGRRSPSSSGRRRRV